MTKIKDNQLLNIYYRLGQKYHILIFSIFFIFLFLIISIVKIHPNFFTLLSYFIFYFMSHRGNTILTSKRWTFIATFTANKEHLELNRISRLSNLLRCKVQLGHLAGGCAIPVGCYLRELVGYKGTGTDQFDIVRYSIGNLIF